jgi:mono/diheme cytochrome c family protein
VTLEQLFFSSLRNRGWLAWPLCVFVLMVAGATCRGQEDDEDRPQFRRGLVGEYVAADGVPHRRVDETVALDWADRRPDVRLPAGPFSVRWRGRLLSIEAGQYHLHVFAAGAVKITLEKQAILDARAEKPCWLVSRPIKLTYGHHPIQIECRSNSDHARIALFWQGPNFALEPVPAWHLFHDPAEVPDGRFEQGATLVRALRCAACHTLPSGQQALPAPDLTRLNGNISRAWLIDWLERSKHRHASRMPAFGLSREEADAITAYLLAPSPIAVRQPVAAPPPRSATTKRENHDEKKRRAPDAQRGRELLVTLGCLACHRVGELGADGLFGGGDLTHVGAKRPANFFERWLADPAAINADHRMPVFRLDDLERRDLSLYLATLGKPVHSGGLPPANEELQREQVERGRQFVARHRCHACHRVPGDVPAIPEDTRPALAAGSRWEAGCLGGVDAKRSRPGYALPDDQRRAIGEYLTALKPAAGPQRGVDGRTVLAERNCLACHARGNGSGISLTAEAVVGAHPHLAAALPAMKPPALHGVGDKFQEQALADAISTKHAPLRPWLKIRMPRFDLPREDLEALVKHFVDADRIPPRTREPDRGSENTLDPAVQQSAGSRLVTSAGFGCTSCHQINRAMPEKDEVRSRGPDLAMLGRRVRREWYERFLPNPARIVPNMEMPSLSLPVRGVLNDNLQNQLAAVWQVVNEPDFTPPQPGAVRVVRCRNLPGVKERAKVLTDVLEVGGKVFIKPLVIGLPNRHSVLFDLETGSLAGWWIGDTAAQRTRGKSWYWEAAGTHVFPPEKCDSELRLYDALSKELLGPLKQGQFVTEFDSLEHLDSGGVRFTYRLHFRRKEGPQCVLEITQSISPLRAKTDEATGARASGFLREIEVKRHRHEFDYRLLPPSSIKVPLVWRVRSMDGGSSLSDSLNDRFQIQAQRVAVSTPGTALLKAAYLTMLPVDSFPLGPPVAAAPAAEKLDVVPGYEAVRLPLPEEIMPTGLAWREDGTLVISSLKGQVHLALDTDGDGLEDRLTQFSDELAAPYGVAAHEEAIDVITKYALLRLYDDDKDGRADRTVTLASGWGHTADYHDWAVGLEKDSAGNYYVALPCQQDDRSPAAARLRGAALKLIPREPARAVGYETVDPRRYRIEEICGGLRFPMGLALSREGQLFASDNQGNYNPFNELNHLRPGRRYGFINKLELKPGFNPPLTPPAIDIPHPWTRSVNGIAFLYTPRAIREQLGRDLFGPFEGQLLGCEYDTRRLIRMSLQKVGDTYQGAAYPFSINSAIRRLTPAARPELQGPVACAVAPSGDVYVGNMRDSGWGAGANVGSVVRLRPSAKLPLGIAEVRAAREGLVIDFTGPVDRSLALRTENYAISSYRRVSTPAYGGKDQNRETHAIRAVAISADARRVILRLDELRVGFVYEVRLKSLNAMGEPMHPDEAYFTLRAIP